MPTLAQRHTVIVPDLRGAGGSAKPAVGGYSAVGPGGTMRCTEKIRPSALAFGRLARSALHNVFDRTLLDLARLDALSPPGRVFGREELLDIVWSRDGFVEPRARLEEPRIETVRGVGYRFRDKP